MRSRLDQLDERLNEILQQARAGALDDVDQTVLGSAIEELTSVGEQLSDTPTPAELAPYAQRWVQVQQGDLAAATALVQARLTQGPGRARREPGGRRHPTAGTRRIARSGLLCPQSSGAVTYTPVT